MAATLVQRGPDSSGFFVKLPVALGHRRLSILDLTEAGAQPMLLGKDGPIIAESGEVYNFLELRKS